MDLQARLKPKVVFDFVANASSSRIRVAQSTLSQLNVLLEQSLQHMNGQCGHESTMLTELPTFMRLSISETGVILTHQIVWTWLTETEILAMETIRLPGTLRKYWTTFAKVVYLHPLERKWTSSEVNLRQGWASELEWRMSSEP